MGLFYKIAIYTLLISFSYVYLYPVLFMFVNSFKTVQDLIDPGVKWIPTTIEIENYQRALEVLQLPQSIYQTFGYVFKVSILATGSSALIGYGFAKFNFPFKRVLFALMLATFILPPQVTMVSNMIIFRDLGIMSSQGSMTYPAFLGQGLNQSILYFDFLSILQDDSTCINGICRN